MVLCKIKNWTAQKDYLQKEKKLLDDDGKTSIYYRYIHICIHTRMYKCM